MSARPQLLSIAERHWRRIAVVLFLLGSLGVVLTRQVRHKPLPLTPPARLSQLSDNIHQQHPEWHLTPLEAGMEEGFFVSVRPLPRLEAEALRRQTTNRREWQGVVLCEPLKTESI
jgi:hypothetical protein